MTYINVAKTTDLRNNEMKMIEINGIEILISNIDGEYYAISNKCPHMGGSLSEGILNGGIISCPKHGAKFDAKTGENVGDAKIVFLKMKVKDDRSYPVKIEDNNILVDLA
ncbi:Rieske 2Fe-2S domain-containing protein [Fusibacter bizertensis]|uniref:Rieske 2Fe-2S domain-containing protein n=1 Tax=Fusibacter bizertensis TaxID=1488331 RepID=A0ABT6NG05_9FIRM|nr:Rieske 2Fe-2S domain-containing protein [Fusibacter bizertensis]MDH8679369.1 Rieske 2Fe-2S domain-containing protein [Fusibacter bizertensis]